MYPIQGDTVSNESGLTQCAVGSATVQSKETDFLSLIISVEAKSR